MAVETTTVGFLLQDNPPYIKKRLITPPKIAPSRIHPDTGKHEVLVKFCGHLGYRRSKPCVLPRVYE